MRGILIVLIGLIVSVAPVFAAIQLMGPPVASHDDDCDDEDDDSVGIGPANGDDDDDDDDDCDDDDEDDDDGGAAAGPRLISESALLIGLEGGALFPFIDTTPNRIVRAHIAITDATETCEAGASAPTNIQVLVGSAGVTLVDVMDATTNTGIGTPTQCVFHVTVVAGANGVPVDVMDIVIVNGGEGPLTGVNTVTVSAEVE